MTPHPTIPWPGLPALPDEARVARAEAAYLRLSTRRSCRAFTSAPVPRAVIEAAIRAAGTAPSGANHQPWHFAVVASPDKRHAIRLAAEAEERAFYAGKAGTEWLEALAPLGTDADKSYLDIAPWLIIVFAQRKGGLYLGDLKQNYYVPESVGIATGLLLATLHEAGLATLTHTPNPMSFLNKVCGRPAHEKATMVVVAGHAAADATVPVHATIKKPLEQIPSWL